MPINSTHNPTPVETAEENFSGIPLLKMRPAKQPKIMAAVFTSTPVSALISDISIHPPIQPQLPRPF